MYSSFIIHNSVNVEIFTVKSRLGSKNTPSHSCHTLLFTPSPTPSKISFTPCTDPLLCPSACRGNHRLCFEGLYGTVRHNVKLRASFDRCPPSRCSCQSSRRRDPRLSRCYSLWHVRLRDEKNRSCDSIYTGHRIYAN